jgi:hypothetical protein
MVMSRTGSLPRPPRGRPVHLVTAVERLPAIVRRYLDVLPPTTAAVVVGGPSSDSDAHAVRVPLPEAALAGAVVLGRLATLGALPASWPEAFRIQAAAFASALPERIERHAVDVARHPFDAARRRGQFERRIARQALELLETAEALTDGWRPTSEHTT